jgi:hypothetical protein
VGVRVVQGRNHPKPIVFILLDLFCDFWTIEDTLCPLCKAVTPMQLCTLYNFASDTIVPRGGRQGPTWPTSFKTHSFLGGSLFCDFWTIEDTLCPLCKAVTPMQLCTLYNFASDTVGLRGERHSLLGRTLLKNDVCQAARDLCGEIHIHSRKNGTYNRERSRLMPMSVDGCFYLDHRMNPRGRRSRSSL